MVIEDVYWHQATGSLEFRTLVCGAYIRVRDLHSMCKTRQFLSFMRGASQQLVSGFLAQSEVTEDQIWKLDQLPNRLFIRDLTGCARIGKEMVVKLKFSTSFDLEQIHKRQDVWEVAEEFMGENRFVCLD